MRGVIQAFCLIGIGVLLMLLTSSVIAAPGDLYRSQVIREAQFRFGVPAPAPIIAAQITQESAWNPQAVSRVGAQGLMQFMPATAKWAAAAGAFGSVDPLNPAWSIRAGVWYDRWLYERVVGESDCDRWMLALSAYNGGLGRVYKRQKLSPDPGNYTATAYINPGISAGNQHENETYAPRIVSRHQPQFVNWGRFTCLTQ